MTLTEEDFRRLAEIEALCFHGSWTEETLRAELNNPLSILCVSRREGGIAAFALGRVAADEGELFQIATLPELRRNGIAEGLLRELHEEMRRRGAACCFLEVRSRNSGAIALYRKCGYTQISVRRGYYDDDDALIFRAEL